MTSASHERAKKAVTNVLPKSVSTRDDGTRLVVNGVPLHIHWLGEGWLRDVRPILESSHNQPDVLVARRMSPGAREAIAEAGLSWVDETGAAEISVNSIVVSRPGHATESPTNWTTSVFAIAEALLCGTRATVKATRKITGLSTGACTKGLRLLEDSGLLVSEAARGRHSGRHIADFDRLLDAYASEVAKEPAGANLQLGITWRNPSARLIEIGAKWEAADHSWACTGLIAASLLAPHLTSEPTAEVYVDADTLADLGAIAREAELQPIEGGRLTIRPFPTVTTQRLAERKQDLCLAPWPRVYADLRTIGVRGEEAAEHLRKVMHD